MTRETKVGLLMGMGVILLIGIILTDHLAVHTPDPLLDVEPADETVRVPPQIIDDRAGRERVRPGVDELPAIEAGPISEELASPPLEVMKVSDTLAESRLAPAAIELQAPQTSVDSEKLTAVAVLDERFEKPAPRPSGNAVAIHHVKSGESLYQIAQLHWGDGKLYPQLIKANDGKIMPGHQIRKGVALVIPDLGSNPSLSPLAPVSESRLPVKANADSKIGRVQVVAGDTLSSLAEQYLGSATLWPELLAANRDIIDDANRLPLGVQLKLPILVRPHMWHAPDSPAVGPAAIKIRSDPPSGRPYRIRGGDTLWKIAERQLGDPHRYGEIVQANPDRLTDASHLKVGMTIELPPR